MDPAPPRGPLGRLAAAPGWAAPVVSAAVALGLRLWVYSGNAAANPTFRMPPADDAVYLRLAGADAPPDWFLAPLYPTVLSLFAGPEGATFGAAAAVNIAAGVLAAAVAAIAGRLMHSPLAGWFAGLLYAGAGLLVFGDVRPGQESLLGLAVVCVLALTARAARSGSVWTCVCIGLVAGVGMLGRGTMVFAAAGAAFVVLGMARRNRDGLLHAGAIAVGMVVVLIPAATRNLVVVGDFTPLPWTLGPNLYMSYGPDAFVHGGYGASVFQDHPGGMRDRARTIAEEAEDRKLRPSEVSAYWRRRTISELPDAGTVAGHAARRAVLFWGVDEYGSNHDIEIERRFSPWTRFTPVTAWWLLALGAGGWFVIRKRAPAADAAAIFVLLTWGSLVVFFPLSRYRGPAVAAAVVCAGAGLAQCAALPRDRRRLAIGAAVTVGVALAAHSPPWLFGDAGRRAPQLAVFAADFMRVGDLPGAERMLDEALALHPGDGRALELRARIELERGRPLEALDLLALAKEDPRTALSAPAVAIIGYALLDQTGEAERAAAWVLERAPAHTAVRAEALANLAFAVLRAGDEPRARALLEQARAIAPHLDAVRRVATLLP